MLRYLLPVFSLVLTGCVVNLDDKSPPAETINYVWQNSEMYQELANGNISKREIDQAFLATKSKCNIESLKIPIPSPSCTQPPKQDCSNLIGAAAGLCNGSVPRQECNYSSVNAARNAQNEVFESCMNMDGWVYLSEKEADTAFDSYSNSNRVGEVDESDIVQAAIDATPELAEWQKEQGIEWDLATAIDKELRSKPEYASMLLVERFRIVVDQVKTLMSK